MKRFRLKALVCCCFLAVITLLSLSAISVSAYAYLDNASSNAECLAVIESSTNRLLYGKNLHKKRPMASTTKIMTAITVLENCNDLDKIVTVPDKAVGVEGSSIYLERGEKVKMRDLLYGLMLQSGNDCAESLAILTSGSIQGFADLMNKTAEKIGAKDSHFMNPHGLHNDYHYTSAYDLAIISAYAMQNPTFKEIVGTKKHTMPWADRSYDRVILNKNKILNTFDGGDGIKTGFTKKAGRCLVSSATRNGMQIIAVVLNCGPMFEECAAYMNKAFEQYSMRPLSVEGERVGEVKVTEGKSASVPVAVGKALYYPLKESELPMIVKKVETNAYVTAPIAVGAEAGKIKFYLANQLLFEEKLITIDTVQELTVWDKLKNLIHGWNQ